MRRILVFILSILRILFGPCLFTLLLFVKT